MGRVKEFARQLQIWDALGEEDPYWAVLSTPGTRGNRWDVEEFLATGVHEIDRLFDRLRGLDLTVGEGRALDFGCGVGRLTRALARRFERADGVDIAPSMIARARELNLTGDRCQFHVNSAADLRIFATGSFDLVYSRITLMHVPPRFTRRYLMEFARVLKPGGLAIFHVPSSMPWYRRPIYELAMLRRRFAVVRGGAARRRGGMISPTHKHEMYFLRRSAVKDLVRQRGLIVVATEETDSGEVHDILYYIRKPAPS